MQNNRMLVKGSSYVLAVSLAGIAGYQFIDGPSEEQIQATAKKEGFTPKPVIPTKNDVPTIAFGTTTYPDGTKVKLTDPAVTRAQGMYFLRHYMSKDAQRFNKTILNVPIYQHEYDAFIDFSYQFGIGNWSKSSMLKNLKLGKYKQACDALLKYKFSGGYDCSTPGNKRCAGVWSRQLERHSKCMGVK